MDGMLGDKGMFNDPIVGVTQQQRTAAALALVSAGMGGHGPHEVPYERRQEIRRALESLGLVESIIQGDQKTGRGRQPQACRQFAGTEKGYNRHLNVYETPCSSCLAWRERRHAERWEGLGLEHGVGLTVIE